MTIPMLCVGLALPLAGARQRVRGTSRLAISLGISPLVARLTVVAFGTRSPESAVSLLPAPAPSPGSTCS